MDGTSAALQILRTRFVVSCNKPNNLLQKRVAFVARIDSDD